MLRREPVVWATAERHLAHEQEPLPLALFQSGCVFRDWALASLDGIGRPYRIAYTSASFSSLLAAVTAGLAVTVLCRSVLPAGVRPLGVAEGFPSLPPTALTLHRGRPGSAVVAGLADYLREGFGADAPAPAAADRLAAMACGYPVRAAGEPGMAGRSPPAPAGADGSRSVRRRRPVRTVLQPSLGSRGRAWCAASIETGGSRTAEPCEGAWQDER